MTPASRKRKASAASTDGGVLNGKIFRILLSPAKTLELKSQLARDAPIPWTKPQLLGKTRAVAMAMKGYLRNKPGKASFAKILSLNSANLIKTATEYWDEFRPPPANDDSSVGDYIETLPKIARPCGFAYSGPAFQGLGMSSISDKSSINYLQDHLRVLDAVYGWLKPMDVIQPYRLEMATKKVFEYHKQEESEKESIEKSTSLVNFWKPEITQQINTEQQQISKDENVSCFFVINLASEEYSSVIDTKTLSEKNIRIIKIIFQTDGRIVSVHAKRARGLMTRYLATHQVNNIGGIMEFCDEGYACRTELNSLDEDNGPLEIIFDRPKSWKDATTSEEKSVKATKSKKSRSK